MKSWEEIRSKYNYGDWVEGIVIHHAHYGVFLDIEEKGVLGLIEIGYFLDNYSMSQDKYPPIGSKFAGVIVAFAEDDRQIRLSAKPSDICRCSQLVILKMYFLLILAFNNIKPAFLRKRA